MRKYLVALVLIGILLFPAVTMAQQTYTMKLALGDNPYINIGDETIPFVTYAQASTFKNVVEQMSQGRIQVELFTGGALGDDRTVLEQLRLQVVQGVLTNEGVLPNWYPPIQVVALPYLLSNEVVAWNVLDGPFGDRLFNDMARESGFRVVSIGSNGGFRMFANNVRPLVTPRDFQGLKIRTQQIPAQMELVRGQGATPTAVSWPEVYTALQTGVVDGAELPVIGAVAQNHHEVVRYITLDRHLYSPMFIVINEQWYRDLPEDLQDAVDIAGEMAATASRGVTQYTLSKVIGFFEDQGIEVTTLTEAQRDVLRRNSYDQVRDWLVERVGERWVNDYERAVNTARRQLMR